MKIGIVYAVTTGAIQRSFEISNNVLDITANSIPLNDGEDFIIVDSNEPPEDMKIDPETLQYVYRGLASPEVTPANAEVAVGESIVITGVPTNTLVIALLPEGEASVIVDDGVLDVTSLVAGTGRIIFDNRLYLKMADIEVKFI